MLHDVCLKWASFFRTERPRVRSFRRAGQETVTFDGWRLVPSDGPDRRPHCSPARSSRDGWGLDLSVCASQPSAAAGCGRGKRVARGLPRFARNPGIACPGMSSHGLTRRLFPSQPPAWVLLCGHLRVISDQRIRPSSQRACILPRLELVHIWKRRHGNGHWRKHFDRARQWGDKTLSFLFDGHGFSCVCTHGHGAALFGSVCVPVLPDRRDGVQAAFETELDLCTGGQVLAAEDSGQRLGICSWISLCPLDHQLTPASSWTFSLMELSPPLIVTLLC